MGNRLMHGGMAGVQGPGQLAATPSQLEPDVCFQRTRRASDQVETESADLSSLQPGDRDLGHPGASGHVGLAQAEPHSYATQRRPKLDRIHAAHRAWVKVTGRLRPAYWRTP